MTFATRVLVLFSLINLTVDLLYFVLDPRLRTSGLAPAR